MTSGLEPRIDEFVQGLRSPVSGQPLRKVHPLLLTDGDREWPFVDGIPFLRTGREALREAAVRAIREGMPQQALALLLGDRRDDAIPPVHPDEAMRVAAGVRSVGEAMEGLNYGLMAPYVLHRWCTPTYLSGLALLEAHAPRGATLFELGCGAGHFLRAWLQAGGSVIGADLVYSYLWLARTFLAPEALLVCCDVNAGLPLRDRVADFSFCHDAFHYVEHKELAFGELERVSASGAVLLGHLHNAVIPNLSPGLPLEVEEYGRIADPEVAYDDADLTRAALSGVPAEGTTRVSDLRGASALALIRAPGMVEDRALITIPDRGARVHLNPLLEHGRAVWPNPKFEQEYVNDWDYLREMRHPGPRALDALRSGDPWSVPDAERLIRERVFLELPERWQ